MATPTVKSTYVMDLETAETLNRLAGEWQVSKSEALRRAIRAAAAGAAPDRVTLFRSLQKAAGVTRAKADRWAASVRAERAGIPSAQIGSPAMMHLDTSFLVRALQHGSPQEGQLLAWLAGADPVSISAFAWAEFLCGPVSDETATLARELLGEPVTCPSRRGRTRRAAVQPRWPTAEEPWRLPGGGRGHRGRRTAGHREPARLRRFHEGRAPPRLRAASRPLISDLLRLPESVTVATSFWTCRRRHCG